MHEETDPLAARTVGAMEIALDSLDGLLDPVLALRARFWTARGTFSDRERVGARSVDKGH